MNRIRNKTMKWVLVSVVIISVIVSGFKSGRSCSLCFSLHQDDDTLVWQEANNFTALFNARDTTAMNQFLPEGFMVQWQHDNFFGKKGTLNAMKDTAVHATLKLRLVRDAQTTIGYSDDRNTACLDASFQFLDHTLAESIKRENGYGLCIMHFRKIDNRWRLQAVHLDLHCTLCDL